jgi:4-diphosphocytidyl-2-C-methyl-D-erythritol kinase
VSGAEVLSPAKINLTLAVTGRRPDGYHDLVSVVAPLAWGDRLSAAPAPDGETTLDCDDPAVPSGPDNLILKAAAAFRAAAGWTGGVRFDLRKVIPMGAGLGGGSSNAASALRLLNAMAGGGLSAEALARVAAGVGSDCPLFLADAPVVMRGRGERIEPLVPAARSRLAGRRVALFKPGFSVATAWAYRHCAQRAAYASAVEAERRLAAWCADADAPAEQLLSNSLETPVFEKFPALPGLLARLRNCFGWEGRMSGSGSALFVLVPPGDVRPMAEVAAAVREAWGPSAWFQDTKIADKSPPV